MFFVEDIEIIKRSMQMSSAKLLKLGFSVIMVRILYLHRNADKNVHLHYTQPLTRISLNFANAYQ